MSEHPIAGAGHGGTAAEPDVGDRGGNVGEDLQSERAERGDCATRAETAPSRPLILHAETEPRSRQRGGRGRGVPQAETVDPRWGGRGEQAGAGEEGEEEGVKRRAGTW